MLLITAEYISQPTAVYTGFAAGTLKISCVIHTVVGGRERRLIHDSQYFGSY
jgi:hypothetical protein